MSAAQSSETTCVASFDISYTIYLPHGHKPIEFEQRGIKCGRSMTQAELETSVEAAFDTACPQASRAQSGASRSAQVCLVVDSTTTAPSARERRVLLLRHTEGVAGPQQFVNDFSRQMTLFLQGI